MDPGRLLEHIGKYESKAGWLYKRTWRGLIPRWKRRWVEVEATELAYFRSPSHRGFDCRVAISLERCQLAGDSPQGGAATRAFKLLLRDALAAGDENAERTEFLFRAETPQECQDWIRVLEPRIGVSKRAVAQAESAIMQKTREELELARAEINRITVVVSEQTEYMQQREQKWEEERQLLSTECQEAALLTRELSITNNELMGQNSQLRSSIEELKNDVDTASAQTLQLQKQLDARNTYLAEELENIRAESLRLREEKKTPSERERDELALQLASTQEEVENLRRQVQESFLAYQDKERQVEILNGELAQIREMLVLSQQYQGEDMQRVQRELDLAKQAVSDMEKSRYEAMSHADRFEKELREWQQKANQDGAINSQMRQELQDSWAALVEMEQKLGASDAKSLEIHRELVQVANTASQWKQRCQLVETRSQQLELALQEKEKQINQVLGQVEEYRQRMASLREELEAARQPSNEFYVSNFQSVPAPAHQQYTKFISDRPWLPPSQNYRQPRNGPVILQAPQQQPRVGLKRPINFVL